jgi:hypothetical protein
MYCSLPLTAKGQKSGRAGSLWTVTNEGIKRNKVGLLKAQGRSVLFTNVPMDLYTQNSAIKIKEAHYQ